MTDDTDLCSDSHGCGDTEGAVQVGEEVPLEEGQGGEEALEGDADGQAGGQGHQGQVAGGQADDVHSGEGGST